MRWILAGAVFLVGIAGVILHRDVIKKVIALGIVNSALVTLFVLLGAESGSQAPIMLTGVTDIVDPVVQALMLTAIVVGVCVTALALVICYGLFNAYGTTDCSEIERIIAEEDE
jgi:multicomponent Na+:H+ antiporter subunit C